MVTAIHGFLKTHVSSQKLSLGSKAVAGLLVGAVLYNSFIETTWLNRVVILVKKIFAEVLDFVRQCFPEAKNPFPDGKYADPALNQKEIARFIASQQQKFDRAIRQSNMTALIIKFLNDPQAQLINIRRNTHNREDCPETYFMHLYECACESQFDRFCNSRRLDIETQFLKNTQELCPKDQELRYLGIGVGGGLQDFINLGKLVRAGYTSIKAVLVDLEFKVPSEKFKKLQTQMGYLEIFAKEMKAKLEISYRSSTLGICEKYHVIQQIDVVDLSQAGRSRALLEENGRFYLAFKTYDLFFSKLELVHTKFFHELCDEITELTQGMEEAVQKLEREHLKIAFLSPKVHLIQWIQILPILCNHSIVKKISLTLFQVTVESIPELNQFFSLITGKEVETTVERDDPSHYSSSTQFDIVADLFSVRFEDQLKSILQKFSQGSPRPILFFDTTTKNCKKILWECVWQWDPASGIRFFGKSSDTTQKKVTALLQEST